VEKERSGRAMTGHMDDVRRAAKSTHSLVGDLELANADGHAKCGCREGDIDESE